jgi:hypothetical protein
VNQTENGHVLRVESPLNGTINAAGQFSGTFTFMGFLDGVFVISGSGTFSGSLTGNVITITAIPITAIPTPQPGDCTTVVSYSGSR